MKSLGIVGGIAPGSTIEYYRLLVALYHERKGDGSYPSILINSIDLKAMLERVTSGDRAGLADYLSAEIERLARAGAELGLLASNTPHLVFDELKRRSPIPLVSLVEATCEHAKRLGFQKLGLLGTRFTMEASFYPDVFARRGMTVVAPSPEERAEFHALYFDDLVPGTFGVETRRRVLGFVERMRARDGIQAAILGGTELSALFDKGTTGEIPLLDTTRIHVDAALERLLEMEAAAARA